MHLFLSLLHFYFKIKQLNLKNRTDAFIMDEKVDNLFSNVPAGKSQEYDFVVWYYLSNSSINIKNVIFVLEKDIK